MGWVGHKTHLSDNVCEPFGKIRNRHWAVSGRAAQQTAERVYRNLCRDLGLADVVGRDQRLTGAHELVVLDMHLTDPEIEWCRDISLVEVTRCAGQNGSRPRNLGLKSCAA